MSTRGKRPAHQNSTAFKHNPNSRLTARIAAIPNDGLCHRCHAIIEWRKQYRKYKPLSQPRKCNQCAQKTVRFAYHTLCAPCSGAKRVCAKCGEQRELVEKAEKALSGEELVRWMGDMGVRERRRRLVLRQWEGGERTDEEVRELVKKYAAEAASRDGADDDDDWDDEDEEDEEMDDEEEKKEEAEQKTDKKQPTTTTTSLSTASTTASTAVRPASTTSSSTSTATRGVDKLTLLRSRAGAAQNGAKSGGRAAVKQAVSEEDSDDFDDDDD